MKEQILNRILEQLPSGQSVTANDLSKTEMPPAVRHFLRQALSRRVGQELKNIRPEKLEWIDTSADLYDDAFTGLGEVLSDLGQFPPDEVETYVSRAVEIVADFLNHPVDTLVDFLFIRDADTTTVADIERRIEYFSIYPHLIIAVSEVITNVSAGTQDTANSEINRSHLHERLTEADRAAGSGYSASQWIETLKPLCDLYAFGTQIPGQFPLELPARFIEKRGPAKLADFLRQHDTAEGEIIDHDTLVKILQEAFRPPPPPAAVDKSQTAVSSEGSGADLPLWKQYTGDAPQRSAANAEPSVSRPLWKTYTEPDPDTELVAENVTDAIVESEKRTPITEDESEKRIPITEVESEKRTPPGELEARVLGRAKKLRGGFIRDLFNGDAAAYETIIESLSRSDNWTESAEILKTNIFVKYKVDIYSESAIAFTNAVEEHIKQFD